MGEILYHMSRNSLSVLANNGTTRQWQTSARVTKHLVAFEVNMIPDMVYIDTEDCRQQIPLLTKQLIPSSIVVHPDQLYGPLQQAGDFCRRQAREGVVYPSARHSQGLAVALFRDHMRSIKGIVATLEVELALVEAESYQPVPNFSPHDEKISHTHGYYEFTDPSAFAKYQSVLQPALPSVRGVVEFIRRPYSRYPSDAVT